MKNLAKILTTIMLITVLSLRVNAQTNVSGFISANTTWNLAGSPYIVVGNALLSHGYTLTIEPGVVVKFETDKALQIDGELIAIGTPQNRITFTSNQVNPVAGDWAKIHFPDTCVDAVFDSGGNYLSGSIMKYCDVMYGGGLGFGEIQMEGSSPYFTHCNIMNSMVDGIYCHESTCVVDSSSLKFCAGYGLSFDRYFVQSNSLLVQDDSILNNSSGGILIGSSGVWPVPLNPFVIRRNVFISNSFHGAIFTGSNYTNGETISENYFFNNSCSTINQTGIVTIFGINYTINCNLFINNQVGYCGALYINDNPFPSTAYITNNKFSGNVSNSGTSALDIGAIYHGNGTIYCLNNLIENNSTAVGATIKVTGYSVPDIDGLLCLSGNNIVSNQAQFTIDLNKGPAPFSSNMFAIIKNNNLVNSGVQYEINNQMPYGDPNIYADSNYWGTTNTQHIDSVIYDYFDFANQSVVYYSPILTTPAAIDTTCPAGIPTPVSNIESTISTIHLFPNPTATNFFMNDFPFLGEKNLTITLTNMQGKIILQQQFDKTKAVDVSSLPNGIYVAEVRGKEKVMRDKVIVQH